MINMKKQFFKWLESRIIKCSVFIRNLWTGKNTCVIARLVVDDDGDQFVQYINRISDTGIGYGFSCKLIDAKWYESGSKALEDIVKCKSLYESTNWDIFSISSNDENSIKEALLREGNK